MSAKAPVAPIDPRTIEDIDGALGFLSESLKRASQVNRDIYIERINKLLDDRNRITNSQK